MTLLRLDWRECFIEYNKPAGEKRLLNLPIFCSMITFCRSAKAFVARVISLGVSAYWHVEVAKFGKIVCCTRHR